MTMTIIPTVAELIEMSRKDRFEYINSIRSFIPDQTEITRNLKVSYRTVNNVFAGNSANIEVLTYILDHLKK